MPAHTFNPSDVQLVEYLNAKITKENDEAAENDITEINLCSHEPEDIPGLTRIPSTHTWHVISPLNRKNGRRRLIKRSTRRGFWRVTGKDTEVKDHQGNKVGSKRYLTFYEKDGDDSASAKHKRTGWVIHELHSSSTEHPDKENYVLCKLMKKPIAPSASSNDGVQAVPSPPVAAAINPIIPHQIQYDTTNFMEDCVPAVASLPVPEVAKRVRNDGRFFFQVQNDTNMDLDLFSTTDLQFLCDFDETQNETNLTEVFCDGLDDFSNGFQSIDLAQLFRDIEEMPTDMIMNWNSGS